MCLYLSAMYVRAVSNTFVIYFIDFLIFTASVHDESQFTKPKLVDLYLHIHLKLMASIFWKIQDFLGRVDDIKTLKPSLDQQLTIED